MKLNKTWQEEWENIEVPKEKVLQRIEETFKQEKKATKINHKVKQAFKRPLYRNSLLAAAAILLVFGANQLLSSRYRNDFSGTSSQSKTEWIGENATDQDAAVEQDWEEEAEISNPIEQPSVDQPALQGDKIAYFYNLIKETTTFDEDTQKIQQVTDQLGGYIESSSIEIRSYSVNNERSGFFTLRIPTNEIINFAKELDALGVTVNESMSSQNYSLEYADNESRISALQAEEDALLSMLEKSERIEDALQIQSQLSQIRGEREILTKSNRVIDNRVDFSTYSIQINEITTIQQNEKSDSAFTKIRNNWRKQLLAWQEFFVNTGIFLASNVVYLIAGIAVVAFIFYRRKKRASK